ncbi:MAG TPA: hypothetical protein VGQ95_11560 [Chthoniobacterales bacterium]|nr:hypothetical protein [Chthoniobacterales bacterium]
MIAVHLDNLLFLLLVAVALLFQLLAKAAGKAGKDTTKGRSTPAPRTPPPVPRAPADSEEERIRKFLEALGQPTTSKPPRPTYQKPIVLPHMPPFGSPLPPLTTHPPDLPRKIKLPGQITPTYEAKTFTPKVAEQARFEVHEGQIAPERPPVIKTAAEAYAIASQPISRPEQTETNITALLRSPSGLRDAIILREIFGPPRSLQPLDLVTGA